MLRVGLTGDLGSGKSTVARMLAEKGAVVYFSDDMGREMMQPGTDVYDAIVKNFGTSVLEQGGALDRKELSKLAFAQGRVEELNAVVHPAVVSEQNRRIAALAATQPHAITVVESALIFSTKVEGDAKPWKKRFDQILLVTAPETQKISRFIQRIAAGRMLDMGERALLELDARSRLKLQSVNDAHASECTVIVNDSFVSELQRRVDGVWSDLQKLEAAQANGRA